jgi:two-component system sensor histidine kinase KdpD
MKKYWPVLRQILIVAGINAAAFAISFLIHSIVENTGLISMVYILAVFLCAVFTDGRIYGVAAALLDTLLVNWAFSFPFFEFNFVIADNLFSALCMVTVSLITSTQTTKLKHQKALEAENELEHTRSNLLRAVSHDLRTPLTSIYGACSAVRENYDRLSKEQQLAMLSQAQEDSQWMIRMVENLLTVTRLQQGDQIQLKKVPVLLEELCEGTLLKFHKYRPAVPVTLDIPSELCFIPMDAMLIEQVLCNLLENAVRHATGMTQLALRVRCQESDAVFVVEDNGCGLQPETVNHIFSGQLHSKENADASRDMGIGLSVCATIVKAHGGHITAENKPAGGALFRFTLPMEEVHDEQ